MFEYESIAKSVEKAIEEGLNALKLEREDVDIKIVDAGGFFKKAKVVLTISDEICEKSEEIKKLKKLQEIENIVKEEPAVDLQENNNSQEEIDKKIPTTEEIKEKVQAEINEVKQEQKVESNSKQNNQDKTNKPIFNQLEECKKFLQGFLEELQIEANIEATENKEAIEFSITGNDLSKLVGFHGECMNSLQYLLSIYCSKFSRHSKRVFLDIDGFKAKRKETLEALANRIATRVQETGKETELEAMNAYERRIIHNVIQNYPDLQSYSKGYEPNRYLVITVKGNEPEIATKSEE